jgi:hypothetical protein
MDPKLRKALHDGLKDSVPGTEKTRKAGLIDRHVLS